MCKCQDKSIKGKAPLKRKGLEKWRNEWNEVLLPKQLSPNCVTIVEHTIESPGNPI